MALPVTPATAGITAIPDPKRSPQSYQAYVAAQAEKANADALAASNAQIQSSYQPILDFYAKQEQQTKDRYAQNSANLKNIFGALTGISATDTKRINDQFASSITKQQQDLATRTAEQRAAQAAGTAQAAATGAERGSGPALQGSPTATATEQGIGQANAIQQNWEGLMGAQRANALTDITNRGAGYGQQEVAANAQMTQNLQDALASIGGQKAGIEAQIAQAKTARDQAIQGNQWDQAAAMQKQIDAMELQASKNAGIENVAKIRAAGQLAAKNAGGGSSTKKTRYANNAIDFRQQLLDAGLKPDQASKFIGEINSIERVAIQKGTTKKVYDPTTGGYKSVRVPLTGAQAYQNWATKYAGNKDYAALVDYAKHYFYDIYNK